MTTLSPQDGSAGTLYISTRRAQSGELEVLSSNQPSYTVGCDLQVRLHTFPSLTACSQRSLLPLTCSLTVSCENGDKAAPVYIVLAILFRYC